jgi:uncharacterized protein YndB with AHSA1/START domain
MEPLQHHLDRSVAIQAAPKTVFRYFTDSARWANWWGAGSTIDARPGGKVVICYPGGVQALGEVVEVTPPERIIFTYGYASGTPIAAGSSRVTIRLEPDESGTRLHLLHEFADEGVRDHHVQGWRYQLSLFGNVVADEVHAGAAKVVDAWYDAWAIADDRAREDAFGKIAAASVSFRDRFSMLDSRSDLVAHSGAAQRFMPGVTLRRNGGIRHCQGRVLADWVASANDGKELMAGTSLFVMGPEGHIQSVTSFTNPPAGK